MNKKLYACLAVALLLRALMGLNPDLSLDEGYSTFFTQVPLTSIFLYAGLDNNPPVGNAFFHIWGALASDNILLWRLPGIIASLFTLLVVYRLLKTEVSESTALLVTIGKTVSLFDVLYAQQIRVYPLAELFLVISWLALRNFCRNGTSRSVYVWGACSAIACHLHYTCWLVVAATIGIGAVFVFNQREKRILFTNVTELFVLLCTPLLFPLAQQLTVYKSYQWIPPAQASVLLAAAFRLSGYSLIALTGVLVLIYSLFVLKHPRTGVTSARSHFGIVIACSTIVSVFIILAYLGSLVGGSFFHPRYFFFIQVPFLTLAVIGFEIYPIWLRRIGASMLICALVLSTVTQLQSLPNWVIRRTQPVSTESSVVGGSAKLNSVFVYQSPCSFLRGGFQAHFEGTHRIVTDESRHTVLLYPGIVPVYMSEEDLRGVEKSVVYVQQEVCYGSETDHVG